jgi:hypothetical protein
VTGLDPERVDGVESAFDQASVPARFEECLPQRRCRRVGDHQLVAGLTAVAEPRYPAFGIAEHRTHKGEIGQPPRSIPGKHRSMVRRLMSPWTAMIACMSPKSEISTLNTVLNCPMKRQSARRPVNTQK